MDWQDDGIILKVRKHGENSAIVCAMTANHGKHSGLVRHVSSKKLRGIVQPGNLVKLNWHARLEEHLGTYGLELITSNVAPLMMEAGKLAAMTSACALVDEGFPDNEPHPELFQNLKSLMVALDHNNWAETYVKWEVSLLSELGFGLDLSECAATGSRENLIYVSPKTGRAVCEEAGNPYRERMLPLPGFFLNGQRASGEDLGQAMKLTGYFLKKHVYALHNRPLPDSRLRLENRLRK